MTVRPIIVELRADSGAVAAVAMAAAAGDIAADGFAAEARTALAGLDIDASFAPVPLPRLIRPSPAAFAAAMQDAAESGTAPSYEPEAVADTYIVRGEIDEDEIETLEARDDVVAVFADVMIEPALTCAGSPPVGTHLDVERLLCVPRLRGMGADGRGVFVAVVDSGINRAYLSSKGKNPNFDAARSWAYASGLTPGSMPVGHGTMCAFDVCIAAPGCTLVDIALLRPLATNPAGIASLLSDAVRAYSHLCDIMRAPRRPGEGRSMVVSNSWCIFAPSWDLPIGNRGNYTHNPSHPFNVIVGTLEGLGADILFAAGNCGANCPDTRCQGITTGTIRGASSHPKVLSVAGVDTRSQRVGYSSQGPGALTRDKPDLCGYTHFAGSGVSAADGGTSAATPVVAGLVAAYRSANPFQAGNASLTPEAVRALFRSSCRDLGAGGYDFDHGFGVVGGCAIADRIGTAMRPLEMNLCALIPRLCAQVPVPGSICQRFPQLCAQPDPLRLPPLQPGLGAAEGAGAAAGLLDLGPGGEKLDTLSRTELAQLLYMLGQLDAQQAAAPAAPVGGTAEGSRKCSCG
jgi:hypothetical protein